MHRRTRVALVASVVAAIAVGSVAVAGVKRQHADYNLRFGYVTGAAHPYGQTMAQFKKNVEDASGGRIAITLLPVYAQGDDNALYNDIKSNTVAGGAVSSAVWPTFGVKSFVPLQLPFVVDSYEFEQRIINNSSGTAKRMISSASAKSGLKVLGIFEGGMRHIVTKAPVNSLADLQGKKLRSVQSNPLTANMRALGISPTPLSVGAVFNAIQGGTVDGAEANSALVATFQWDRAGANVINLVNWYPFPAVVAMNKGAFDALPADLQKVIVDQSVPLPTFSIGVVTGDGNQVTVPTTLCNRGAKYHTVPTAVRNQMIKRSQGVIKKLTVDPEVRSIYNTIRRLKAKYPVKVTDKPPASCVI